MSEIEKIHLYGCIIFTTAYDENECGFLLHGADSIIGCAFVLS